MVQNFLIEICTIGVWQIRRKSRSLSDDGNPVGNDGDSGVSAGDVKGFFEGFVNGGCGVKLHIPDHLMVAVLRDDDDMKFCHDPHQYLILPLIRRGGMAGDGRNGFQ